MGRLIENKLGEYLHQLPDSKKLNILSKCSIFNDNMMLTCSEYTTGYLSEKSNGIWCEHLIVRVVKRKGGKMKYINK